MLPRKDIGNVLFDTRQRVRSLETNPAAIFGEVTVNNNLILPNHTNNTVCFINSNKYVVSKTLDSLLIGTANQINVESDSYGTITLSTPQNIHTSAIPSFGGLSINGNISILGTVDGVDVSSLNNSYSNHTFNSTTAHFGQDLTTSGKPVFSELSLTSAFDSTSFSSGSLTINGGMGIEKSLYIG
jgi:hypothetical protein